MAKKGGSKVCIFRDSTTGSPVDHQKMTTESNKQKIAKIHDIFPTATKDQIAKILQYYEDDENKAVDALTRDGGVEALRNLTDSGSLKSKNNKNKKKKKKGRRDLDLAGSATASFDADDSSSLHSSGNVDAEVEKECAAENGNGVLHYSGEETKEMSHERLNTPETDASSSGSKECVISKNNLENEPGANLSMPEVSKCSVSETENPVCISPGSDRSDKREDLNIKKDKYKSIREENHGKHSSRQRTNSFRRSKTSSLSEDSLSTQNAVAPTKRGYDRCKKDLNRQAISLQRIYTQVDKGLEESAKKIKNSFNELRKLLDKRQEQLEQELSKTKEDACKSSQSRQDLATDLKRRVDRTMSIGPLLNETEWSELRSDVKQFVTERKYDDELGKTIWYQWSMDSITENIQGFGEVHHVKNLYSQRSHSALGNAAVLQSNPEPSPSSSLANEEICSTADKNDVANILDAVEDETPVVKKETSAPAPRIQTTENRGGRVFSNSKYANNNPHRGNRGGGYRGARGYGYAPRPNNRNNMGYRNNYHHDYSNDYRSHSYQERDGRAHDNPMYSNERNMNSHRNNTRGDRRGGGLNNPYRENRYRGSNYRGQHRHNNENIAKTEPVLNETSAVDTEKVNVANGGM